MIIEPHALVDQFSKWLWAIMLIVVMLSACSRVTIWLVAAVIETWRKSFPKPDTPKLAPWPPPPPGREHDGPPAREWTGPAEDMR